MPFDFQRARPLLHSGNLAKLFVEELGWEPCRQSLTLRAGETDYAFTAVAEKRGFTAWLCACANGYLPDHNTRLKLDRALAQTSFEHLIVFATADLCQQSWVWVRREPGRPLSAKTHEFNRGQPGDSLLAKLQILYVSLEEEEEGLSITQMAGRARAAFDIERITKAFYREFDTHRKAFLKFIDGIGEVADREWYASVMLNRLMFVYFIQRKGFLDGDPHYLRNRLKRCQTEHGKDKFYTFYRYFLLRLFHEGFGKRRKDRAPDLEKLLGSIPYLNGGLFDVHELERPDRTCSTRRRTATSTSPPATERTQNSRRRSPPASTPSRPTCPSAARPGTNQRQPSMPCPQKPGARASPVGNAAKKSEGNSLPARSEASTTSSA